MWFYYFVYFVLMNPIGWMFMIVILFLLGACVTGMVDFKRKKKPLSPKPKGDEKAEVLRSVRDYLADEVEGDFEVRYFDGAFQVFATPDLTSSDETLIRRLQLRFPQSVFVLNRTLHSRADISPGLE